jgi:hypothetical protein
MKEIEMMTEIPGAAGDHKTHAPPGRVADPVVDPVADPMVGVDVATAEGAAASTAIFCHR